MSFIKVRCGKCRNEQVVFKKATMDVNCLVCNEPLAKPTGGKAQLEGQATLVEELS